MTFNINKTPAASAMQGLGYVNKGTGVLNISSFSFGAGTTRNFTLLAPSAIKDAASINLVQFSGVGNTDVNNQWSYLTGSMFFRNTNYDIGCILQRTSSGQTLIVQVYNSTVGSTVTVPNITVTLRSYFYTAPWD